MLYLPNASVIWLLYPENLDDFDELSDPILRLKFDKNKLSSFRGYQKLRFLKEKGIIEEAI